MNTEHEVLQRIPAALTSIRIAAGLSQEELAAMIGISRSTLRRYESGQGDPPPIRVTLPWCRACGYSPKLYIEYVYGVSISDTTIDDDRAAIIHFARTAPPEQISALAPVARMLTNKKG